MKLALRVALLVLVGTAAVLASTAAVDEAHGAQFGGRNGVRGRMPGGGTCTTRRGGSGRAGRCWDWKYVAWRPACVQCGWRCMMPSSGGRTWQHSNGRIWQGPRGSSSFRYLLSVAEQQQAPAPAPGGKESAQQWRNMMPSSNGRIWQGGSTGRIWQG
ncbi:hypothetical protein COO60DRAFT_1699583 [Scenedesmus sp. NREL 46B-D3]|nr:hypothetical protein COO60DRAFT_1699583 [Scenedesmus sp. NREL 46B-D3]